MASAPPSSSLYITSLILLNSCTSIAYTLTSKRVLKLLPLPLPLTLLWIQAVVSVCVLGAVGVLYPRTEIRLGRPWRAWRAFLPLALTRLLGALSKTACLANVDAAFYQTARGLLLPFTVLLSFYFVPSTRFTPLTLLGITLVILGFVGGIAVDLQQSLSLNWGVALGVWSSFTTAVETVVLKRYAASNAEEDMGMLQLIYMSSLVACIVYAPLVLAFEGSPLPLLLTEKDPTFLPSSLLSSLLALLLSFATWLQISATSPVTHTVVAATRGVVQSLLAALFFGEALPVHRGVSTVLILGGTGVYTWSKMVVGRERRGGRYERVEQQAMMSPSLLGEESGGTSSTVQVEMGSPLILRTPKLV